MRQTYHRAQQGHDFVIDGETVDRCPLDQSPVDAAIHEMFIYDWPGEGIRAKHCIKMTFACGAEAHVVAQ